MFQTLQPQAVTWVEQEGETAPWPQLFFKPEVRSTMTGLEATQLYPHPSDLQPREERSVACGRQELGRTFVQAVDEGRVSLESSLLEGCVLPDKSLAWGLPHGSQLS